MFWLVFTHLVVILSWIPFRCHPPMTISSSWPARSAVSTSPHQPSPPEPASDAGDRYLCAGDAVFGCLGAPHHAGEFSQKSHCCLHCLRPALVSLPYHPGVKFLLRLLQGIQPTSHISSEEMRSLQGLLIVGAVVLQLHCLQFPFKPPATIPAAPVSSLAAA